MRLIFGFLVLISILQADSIDEVMEGFDNEPSIKKSKVIEDDIMSGFDNEPTQKAEKKSSNFGLTGTITEETAYSIDAKKPHNGFSSLKTSLFLDYEKKFENGFKFKTNVKSYYNAIYNLRDRDNYSKNEIDELESEIELFDAYIEGSLSEKLDIKVGRQVVVWGRSDTIRVTDILNPIDNRRPAMVDIEDLRITKTSTK